MFRKRVASGTLGIISAVASTVVGMIWPTLDPSIGLPILWGCAGLAVLAIILWIWPEKSISIETEAERAYALEAAKQKAIDEASERRKKVENREAWNNAFGLNFGHNLREQQKDREADREAVRQRKIAEASAPRGSIKSRIDQQFPEIRRKFEAILANPIPNINMKEALGLITEKSKKENAAARDELQDLASIGAIAVWGRSYKHKDPNPLVAIQAGLWSEHYMFWYDDIKNEADHQGITQCGTDFGYRDLRFCKEQITDHYATRR